jgi:hypothetical protein
MDALLMSQLQKELTKDEDILLEEWYIAYLTNVDEPENIPVGTVPPIKELLSKFETWFLNNREKIKKEFCAKWTKEELQSKYIENMEMVGALADLLLSMYKGIQIPGFATLSAIIISKRYLNALCE